MRLHLPPASPLLPHLVCRGRTLIPVLIALLGGCGGGDAPPAATPVSRRVQETILTNVEEPSKPPEFAVGRCRVYTSEPGWSVFIDGCPVRGEGGRLLETPCVVEALAGSHSVTVARGGRVDQSRQVLFADDAEQVFDTANVPEGESLLLTAPYLDLPVGRAVSLNSLNSTGKEFDPFLGADGRGIVFAADRSEGRGIYTATRPTPLHPFDPPQLLRLTSSSDQAASPSVNGEATMIVYTIPAKGRIRALTRSSPLAEYEQPQILLADDSLEARYPSAQITAEADRIYFAREEQGITETRVAFPTPGQSQPFGGVRLVGFPGEHPRLSHDSLRQYLFDGKTLRRARREAVHLPFLGSEKLCDLELPRYQPSSSHRQFCVSEDEQWLFYCDDPLTPSGDLWMVRLSDGPGWGVPLRGSAIPPRLFTAGAEMKPAELFFDPPPVKPAEPEAPPPPDPRSLPLPYVVFQQALSEATAARQFTQAMELVQAAEANPDLQPAAELIAWDRQEVEQLLQFWRMVEQAASQLRPGDALRIGSIAVEFEKYEEGIITAKARSQSIDKPLLEFDSATLVSLAERVLDPKNPADMVQAVVFLSHCGDGTSSRRGQLLAAAGNPGVQFTDRVFGRELALCRMEIDRENIGVALERIRAMETKFSNSSARQELAALREALYTRTEWNKTGNRNWQTGPEGEYTADTGRSPGSLLRSPTRVSDFQLLMEYRTTASTGQGGVYFTYSGQGRIDTVPKVQLSNDAGITRDPYCTGALFGVTAPKVNAAKPMNEWNTFQMTVRGQQLTVVINGQEVLNTTLDVGNRPREGFVALDGAAGGISYRRIILSDRSSSP